MIKLLKKEQSKELENLFAHVFGEKYREEAKIHIDESFGTSVFRPYFLIKVIEEKIVAAAAVSEANFTSETWGISWVAVDLDYQKTGLGKEIINACMDFVAEQNENETTVLLCSYDEVTKFYKDMGFDGETLHHDGGPFLTTSVTKDRLNKSALRTLDNG